MRRLFPLSTCVPELSSDPTDVAADRLMDRATELQSRLEILLARVLPRQRFYVESSVEHGEMFLDCTFRATIRAGDGEEGLRLARNLLALAQLIATRSGD